MYIKIKKWLLWAIWLILFIMVVNSVIGYVNGLWQSRFGYFTDNISQIHYGHANTDTLTLKNGNILFLGSNSHKAYNLQKEGYQINKLTIKEEPCEIYDYKKNEFRDFKLPSDIAYYGKGILLNDNRLLLTYAYNPYDKNIKYAKYATRKKGQSSFPYDSMAIINLETKQVETMVQKKINKNYEPNPNSHGGTTFTLLGNGKVLIIDFINSIAEIYNPNTSTSKILNIEIIKDKGSVVIAQGENKALIFGPNKITKKQRRNLKPTDLDTVLEYDDATETIKVIGKTIRREYPIILRLNSDNILIMGGNIVHSKSHLDIREIEIYNTKTNSSKIIGHLKTKRKFDTSWCRSTFAAIPIDERYILITGGLTGAAPNQPHIKSTEILDLKKNKTYWGPNMNNSNFNHKMIKLNNGNILIVAYKMELFIAREWRK